LAGPRTAPVCSRTTSPKLSTPSRAAASRAARTTPPSPRLSPPSSSARRPAASPATSWPPLL
ncbi:hypothetical protein OC844_007965, partial [Tilletia horrida]